MTNQNRGKTLSPEAFCALYDQFKDDLFRYACYKLGSREDAEDAVQDAVLDAWRQIGNLRSADTFRAWIFTILHGCCARRIKDVIRRREKARAAAVRASDGEHKPGVSHGRIEPDMSDPGEMVSTRMSLEQALTQVDDQTKEIIMLSVIGGLNSREIAGMIDMEPGSVRSRLSRGLKAMREYLEND